MTGLGTGYLPVAPGTWGSAAVWGIVLAVVWAGGVKSICINGTLAAIAVVSSVACVWLGEFTERSFRKTDPSQCTIDEWAGQAVAMILLPYGMCSDGSQWVLLTGAAFIAFRIFDIVKPPPARSAEKLTAGLGILTDDIVAGIYANVGCQILFRVAIGSVPSLSA